MAILRVLLAFVLVLAARPAVGARASGSATDERPSTRVIWRTVLGDGLSCFAETDLSPRTEETGSRSADGETSAVRLSSDSRTLSPAERDARDRWSVEERVTSLLHGEPSLRTALAKRAPEKPEPFLVARIDRVEPLQPDVRVEVARDPWDAHDGEVWGALVFGAIAVLASLVQIGIW